MSTQAEAIPHHPHPHQHYAAMDASKLNHAPAPLPIPSPVEEESNSPPLRSPDGSMAVDSPSGYLDGNDAPAPSHPTVAETGALCISPGHGPGPSHGQLQRRESQVGRRIIRLASFGGEGLVAKPPPPQTETPPEEAIE